MSNEKEDKQYATGTIPAVIELKNAGKTYDQITQILGITKGKVISDLQRNRHMWTARTKEERSQIHTKYSAEQKTQALFLKSEGVSAKDIERVTGVKTGILKLWTTDLGLQLTRDQKNNNLKHENVIKALPIAEKLKIAGKSNLEIAQQTGASVSSIKRRFKVLNLIASDETISKNLSVSRQPIVIKAKAKFINKVAERNGKILGFYINSCTHVLLSCDKGHEWKQKPGDVLNNNQWCPRCYRAKQAGPSSFIAIRRLAELGFTSHLERYQSVADSFGGKCLATEETITHKYVDWQCDKGHKWGAKPYSVIAGHHCPYCANVGPSKAQLEIYEYIKTLLPDETIELSNRQVLSVLNLDHPDYRWPLELDIYVPSRKLSIEFNGLYWHCSALDSFKSGKDRLKAVVNQKLGNNYLMIFEDEWETKKELIKSMIRWRLQCFNGTRLGARDSKLTLRLIDKKKDDVASFFNRNHLEGFGQNFSFGFGIFLENKLIQCATVKARKGEYELLRLATDYDYQVQGGSSKLIKKIKEYLKGAKLYSYSNNRLSEGEIYSDFGVEEITQTTQAGYFYTDGKIRLNRWFCQKNKVDDQTVHNEFKTEEEMAEGGVFAWRKDGNPRPMYKIEDAGHRKWLL